MCGNPNQNQTPRLRLPNPSFSGRVHSPRISFFLALLLTILWATPAFGGSEIKRSMTFIRALLMGGAYVAVADEPSTVFYNPATVVGLPESTWELMVPQVLGDSIFKQASVDPTAVSAQYEGMTEVDFMDQLGETVYINVNLRLPVVVRPESGTVFGLVSEVETLLEIMENPVLPGLHLRASWDKILFITWAYKLSDNFYFGWTPKVVERVGIDKYYTFGELFATGALSFDSDPAYAAMVAGDSFMTWGVDLGFLWKIPGYEDWNPRIGLSMLNIGEGQTESGAQRGLEFGPRLSEFDPPQAGSLSQINTIGIAVNTVDEEIRYTLAMDIVDFTRTALPGVNFLKRVKLGFEMGLGLRDDGTTIFSVLAGLNGLQPSFGIMSRVGIYEAGMGTYAVERGHLPGDNPDRRVAVLFGLRI